MSEAKKTSTLAILALVFSILCFPVGVVLAIIALVQISKNPQEQGGKGLAIAGLVISVVAVPLVGILSAIAIPQFLRYQMKAKQVLARTDLLSIAERQEDFKTKYGAYASIPASGHLPGATPWEFTPDACSSYCAPDDVSACSSFACIEWAPTNPVKSEYACRAAKIDGEPHFTCAVMSDLDGDGDYSLFLYGTGARGEPTALGPPSFGIPVDCPSRRAYEIVDCTPGKQ